MVTLISSRYRDRALDADCIPFDSVAMGLVWPVRERGYGDGKRINAGCSGADCAALELSGENPVCPVRCN